MQVPQTAGTAFFVAKMKRLAALTEQDISALSALPLSVENVPAHRFLVREGETVTRCCLLLEGYACRHKMARSGQRQIVAFQMAGDIVDLQHSLLAFADHNVQTVTAATVGWITIASLKELAQGHPKIAEAFAKDALIDASIFREWVLNVGARDAKTRVAHMLSEFIARREAAGISPAEAMELPFTQEQIGDATGLTSVHVNRMLRELTEEGAFDRAGREYRIADWRKLQKIADFDPAYLHQVA